MKTSNYWALALIGATMSTRTLATVDTVCLPHYVVERYQHAGKILELATTFSLTEFGGVIEKLSITQHGKEQVLPKEAHSNVTFRIRTAFWVCFVGQEEVASGKLWTVASEIIYVKDGECWTKVNDGKWLLNCYDDGTLSVEINYVLGEKSMHVDLVRRGATLSNAAISTTSRVSN